jgi:sensor histidine kinase YesM
MIISGKCESTEPTTIAYIVAAVEIATKLWEGIVKLFKTSVSVKLVEILSDRGFLYFEQSGTVRRLVGLRPEYLDYWISQLQNILKIPPEFQHGFNLTLQEALWSDSSVWTANKASFPQTSGGDIKTLMLVTHNNPPNSGNLQLGTTDWFIVDISATFQLAPDLYVYEISKSVLGGLQIPSELMYQIQICKNARFRIFRN